MSAMPRNRAGTLLTALAALTMLALPVAWATESDPALPKPLKVFRPEYPKAAIADDIEGWVDVEFTVATDGTVHDVTVVEADPPHVFDRAAVRAVSRWVYEPARQNGVAVEAHMHEHILFQP